MAYHTHHDKQCENKKINGMSKCKCRERYEKANRPLVLVGVSIFDVLICKVFGHNKTVFEGSMFCKRCNKYIGEVGELWGITTKSE